jgi:hypothetical protein
MRKNTITFERVHRLVFAAVGVTLFICSGYHRACAQGQLEIRIWTEKEVYFSHEPIFVHFELKNVGDSSFAVSATFDYVKELFHITNDKGRRCLNTLLGFYCGNSILQPGESYKDSEEIGSRYGVTGPGIYTCFLEVQHHKSNILKFRIIEPEGDEKKALDLYLEADNLLWCNDKDPVKFKRAFYKFLELVEKYPKSVYAPRALRLAVLRSEIVDKPVLISVCKKHIENYPDSPYLGIVFLHLAEYYEALKDKRGAEEYMNFLIGKYPNTSISERAENWLKKIEKWEF